MIIVLLLLSTMMAWFLCRKTTLAAEVKTPLMVFCGAYIVTTLIGGTLIGIANNEFAMHILQNSGIRTHLLAGVFDLGYWVLLYGTLLTPIWVVLLFSKMIINHLPKITWLAQPIDLVSFWFVLSLFLSYILFRFLDGFSFDAFRNLINDHNYKSTILLRVKLINTFGSFFYGIVYMCLPIFAHIALFQSIKTKKKEWQCTLLFLILFTTILYLLLIQKSLILIFLVTIAIGCYALKVVRFSRLGLVMGVLITLIITLYQNFILQKWTILDSMNLIFFRVASSFPFFYGLYPKVLPYTGFYLGVSIFGFGTAPNVNQVMWSYMYPVQKGFVTGAVVGNSTLMAYTQGGFSFAIINMLLTGIIISIVGSLGRELKNPFQYALFILGLMFLYYLTQISLQSALFTSYGVIWGVFVLGILFFFSSLFRSALKNYGQLL